MNNFFIRENTTDKVDYESVYLNNSYKTTQYNKEDIIIDVGCSIGTFSKRCLDNGVGQILAFEIDDENFNIANRNLKYYNNFTLIKKAVWGKSNQLLNHGSYYKDEDGLINTGCSHVLLGGDKIIETISLNDIVEPFKKIKLIKLDCEGSEFDILYNFQYFNKVEQFCGELHGFFETQFGLKQCNVNNLLSYLEKYYTNIKTEIVSKKHELYLFWAFN